MLAGDRKNNRHPNADVWNECVYREITGLRRGAVQAGQCDQTVDENANEAAQRKLVASVFHEIAD
jgi:hypothetical protein